MQTLQAQLVKTTQNRSQRYKKNSECNVFFMCQGVLKTQINLNSRENICTFVINHISQENIPNF